MKKHIIVLAALLLAIVGNTFAADRLYIENFELLPGETKTVDILLDNPDAEYRDMQFDLYLPDGISVVKNGSGKYMVTKGSRCTEEHAVGLSFIDGHYVCTLYSVAKPPLAGNSGKVLSITLKAADDATIGQKSAYFRNVCLSKANATGPTYSEFSFGITVKNPEQPVTVTANNQTMVYGDEVPSLTYKKEGAELNGTPQLSTTATKTSAVGTYPITVTKGTVTNTLATYVNGTLTITKAPLTVTAKSYTIKQGDALPNFDVNYAGFKNNETASVLTQKATASCAATSWSDAGSYEINVSGAKADNYDFSYVKGTLTITEADPFNLTYMVDGNVYKTYQVKYGAAITPEANPTKEGYTFSGWSEIPATMPAKDVTVTGSFTINNYKLTYKVDGETYKTISIDYGTNITAEAEPVKEGYTFSGWSDIPAKMPAKDVTVTGSFSINKYTLTYKVDGETYKTTTVGYGITIIPEEAPTKEGYMFSGWSEIPSTMPAKDVTITGTFTKGQYKLIYMVDAQTYKTINFDYGVSITPEKAPEREGYTFSGWSEIPATMPAKDLAVTGSFTINKYTLTYQVDGQIYKTISMDYGNAITLEKAPEKEGYTFSGWSAIPTTMPAKDVTITGTFTINRYKLIYMVDGDTYKTYDVEYGSNITPEADPSREGKTFSGWSEIPAKMPAKDVMVTGNFATNNYKLIYVVDGETYKTVEVAYGTAIMSEVAPTKEGHTFSGWSWIPSKMPAEDVTVKGSFTINRYTLTYKVDGETYKTISVDYGTAIIPEGMLTKEGYTFSGWSSIPETMPAKDVTVTGSFTINKYTLTYTVNDETYKTYEVTYGNSITAETEPTKEGYTFSGWSEIPATMPAHDVTVTGSFTRIPPVASYKRSLSSQTTGSSSMIVGSYVRKSVSFNLVNMGTESIYVKELVVKNASNYAVVSRSTDTSLLGNLEGGNSIALSVNLTSDITTCYEWHYTYNGKDFVFCSDASDPAMIHDVTFYVDDIVWATYEYYQGDEIFPEDEPAKEGYTFSGWSEIPATMPNKDVAVKGTFTANTYTLTYKVDGEAVKTSNLEYGKAITPEAEPTKEGYTFSGWSEIPATMPAKDVTVTGSFTINKYTLSYTVNGETYKTYEVSYGNSITAEAEPTKEGYTFSGWSEIPATMPAHDVTITGSFTRIPPVASYKRNLSSQTTGMSSMIVGSYVRKSVGFNLVNKGSESIYVKEVVVKNASNYAVVSRSTDTSLLGNLEGGNSIELSVNLTSDITTCYEWHYTYKGKDFVFCSDASDPAMKHDVTFYVDDNVLVTYEYDTDDEISPEEEPTKEGYTFSGWSEIPATMPNKNVTVKGTFTANIYTLTYEVDGEAVKTSKIECGKSITEEEKPQKEGYTFVAEDEVPSTMPANDVTIKGAFTVNKYTLIYVVDEETIKTYEVEYGTAITAEAEPIKEGYTFSGWSAIPATMPANDVAVTGSFIINKYTLTYMVDGEEYKAYEVEYGTDIKAEIEPTKEGYTFSGWSEVPGVMPANDVTVTGMFAINKYTLTYKVNDEIYKTYEVEFGTTITAEEEPTKEGYTFSGWSAIPATMPAENVTVTGDFTFIDAIEDVIADDDEYQIFTLDGKNVESLQKGVNIIRYSDGTTKSVYVK